MTIRRERLLIVCWLGVCALFLIGFAKWGLGHRGIERSMEEWSGHWVKDVEHGALLVESGRWEQAAAYLTALDRDFPAVSIKQRFAPQRERLLELLAQSHLQLDRTRKTLDTLGRQTEARDAFEKCLQLDPDNTDALTSLAELHPDNP